MTDQTENVEYYHCDEKHEKKEPHTCPYQEEINGSDKLCTCCDYCEYQCARDI